MRFFPLLDFQSMALALFLGLICLVLVYIAWGAYPGRPPEEKEITEAELLSEHEGAKNPVAPFLIFVFVGAALWALAYAVIEGIFGGPIG